MVVTDQPGLFEKITGALAITGLNILDPVPSPEDDLAIDVFVGGKMEEL